MREKNGLLPTDKGYIDNTRSRQEEAVVADVILLQVINPYIIGGINHQSEGKSIDQYFLLNTQTGKKELFSTNEAWTTALKTFVIQPKLQPFETVFRKFRITWFDWMIRLLLVIPPFVGFLYIVRWIVRLRQES